MSTYFYRGILSEGSLSKCVCWVYLLNCPCREILLGAPFSKAPYQDIFLGYPCRTILVEVSLSTYFYRGIPSRNIFGETLFFKALFRRFLVDVYFEVFLSRYLFGSPLVEVSFSTYPSQNSLFGGILVKISFSRKPCRGIFLGYPC